MTEGEYEARALLFKRVLFFSTYRYNKRDINIII